MEKLQELRTITVIIKYILEKDEATRESDDTLYQAVCSEFAEINGIDFRRMPADVFISSRKELGFPSYDSVTRIRRKVQTDFPELQSKEKVKKWRESLEEAYKDYSTNRTNGISNNAFSKLRKFFKVKR